MNAAMYPSGSRIRYTMRVKAGSIAVPRAESASCTTGTNAAARIATMPMTKLTPVADDARAPPRVPRASASSSVVRASESGQEDLQRRHPEGQHGGQAAVVRHHDVALRIEGKGAADT